MTDRSVGTLAHGSARRWLVAVLILTLSHWSASEAAAAAPAEAANSAAGAPAMTESQRDARELLDGMGEYLAGLKAFSMTIVAGYDAVQSNGQKIEFSERHKLTLDRPTRLRMEQVTSDGRHDLVLFDGRQMTVLDGDTGAYAQAPQPDTVDDAIIYFVRDLKLRMPLAPLVLTHLPIELKHRFKNVDQVETTDLLGVLTHHLAAQSSTVDLQVWVTDGPRALPMRIVLTYKKEPGQPQFWATFSSWNTHPKITNEMFEFHRPKNAHQVVFAVQVPSPTDEPPVPAVQGEIKP